MWILWVCNSPRGILLQHVWCKIIMLLLCHPKNSQIWWFQPSRIPMYGKNVHIIPPTYCISQNFWQFAFTTPPFWGSQGCVTWLCYHLLIFDPMYMYIFTHVNNMYVCIKNNTMYICKYTYLYIIYQSCIKRCLIQKIHILTCPQDWSHLLVFLLAFVESIWHVFPLPNPHEASKSPRKIKETLVGCLVEKNTSWVLLGRATPWVEPSFQAAAFLFNFNSWHKLSWSNSKHFEAVFVLFFVWRCAWSIDLVYYVNICCLAFYNPRLSIRSWIAGDMTILVAA